MALGTASGLVTAVNSPVRMDVQPAAREGHPRSVIAALSSAGFFSTVTQVLDVARHVNNCHCGL